MGWPDSNREHPLFSIGFMSEFVHVKIFGVVQGVGFRPFVYKLAASLGLKGWVRNVGDGVEACFVGNPADIEKALDEIKFNNPPKARVDRIEHINSERQAFDGFSILESPKQTSHGVFVPPDIGICDNCAAELVDPNNQRYRHPFISCTDCGPRLSILESLPYDRHTISQKIFSLCEFCADEYKDPLNRRYHAQTIACNRCGPKLFLGDLEGDEALKEAIQKIKDGEVVAIKGIGGFHLAANATCDAAVKKIRDIKKRGNEPLAVMVSSVVEAVKLANLTDCEEELLRSWQKPIVICQKSDEYNLSNGVAPGTDKIGLFLPYTPLHVLLLQELPTIVLTSANLHEEPIATEDSEMFGDVAVLSNDRPITIPIDDSVCDCVLGKPRLLRRARGYVPELIPLKSVEPVLALGPQMKGTFCFSWDNNALVSQHIGEMGNASTFERYKQILNKYRSLFGFCESVTACDLHPGYTTTLHAKELSNSDRIIKVQHHHAHIASVIGEYDLDEPIIGVAADGTGYGTDGTIWGFEFLVANRVEFVRAGHLRPFALPGGEVAIKEASRILYSLLHQIGRTDVLDIDDNLKNLLDKMIIGEVNSPITSSLGRLFDGFAVLAGIGETASFEAQLAISLEALFDKSHPTLPFPVVDMGDHFEVDWRLALERAILNPTSIPGGFHKGIAMAIINGCRLLRDKTGITKIALSGGCFANRILLELTHSALEKMGFQVYINRKLPPGDGCVSFGQAVVAQAKLERGDV